MIVSTAKVWEKGCVMRDIVEQCVNQLIHECGEIGWNHTIDSIEQDFLKYKKILGDLAKFGSLPSFRTDSDTATYVATDQFHIRKYKAYSSKWGEEFTMEFILRSGESFVLHQDDGDGSLRWAKSQ